MLHITHFYISDFKITLMGVKYFLVKLGYYLKKYLLLVSFTVFILGISFVNFISKEKPFSDMENRYLQIKPHFTFKKFIKGEFTNKYEQFINDQFIFRDTWINIKMLSEMLFLKLENNNIIIGKDNYMFDKLISVDEHKLHNNIQAITRFIKNNQSKNIVFTVIPNSYEVLKNKLPIGLNNIEQTKYISAIYKMLNVNKFSSLFLVNSEKFLENKSDKIYYCTDHHWTTKGAYFFYKGLADVLQYKPIDLSTLKKHKVEGFYGTYYSRAKIAWKKPDEIIYYNPSLHYMDINNKRYSNIYDFKKFNSRDKYAGFLYGNNGFSVIKSKYSKNKKNNILVIKDSYANSFIPFLTYNYNNIYVVDSRYIKNSDAEMLMKKYDVNDILIMYNFINFVSDTNIDKLDYFKDLNKNKEV